MKHQTSYKPQINSEIDCKVFVIYGKMRNGKTLLASCISANDFDDRIYSNFHIYREGESIVNHMKTYQALQRIRFSKTHGVIAIDEGGLNVNSKDSQSKTSRIMHEVLFYAGKKNCSVIFCAQRYNSVDVNFRELADLIIEVVKFSRSGGIPIFYCKLYKQLGTKQVYKGQYEFSAIEFMDFTKLTYDTLEASALSDERKKELQVRSKKN